MKFFLNTFLLVLLGCVSAWAQKPISITGEWSGTTNILGGKWLTTYTLVQKGALIEGFSTVKSRNGKDSTKVKLSGQVKENEITLQGTEFVYNSLLSCLTVVNLTYTQKDGVEKLTGKWKGDWQLTTCPPGTSGKIALIKTLSPEMLATTDRKVEAPTHIYKGDFEGNALLEELGKRKYYAFIIGINDYKSADIPSLDNPVSDALKLRQVLYTHYAFDDENIVVLQNPTRSQIIEGFDEMSAKLTEKDQLLIFYAGHGIWDETLQKGFWLPADASMSSKAQWVSNSTIRDYIGGIKSRHTLLITDACFSGSIFKGRGGFSDSKAILEMYKLPSRKAMTSGALKTVPDQSVFIEYLLKNLIHNHQPMLSSADLFADFRIAVINNSPNGQVPQYGAIGQTGDEGGEFIFLKRISGEEE